MVLTSLLYGCETWTVYRRHEKQINYFHLRCLRNILHIRWQEKVPDTEVLKQVDIPSAITIMRKAHLRWAGHVSHMPNNRIPKQLLYGELCCGKHTAGGRCVCVLCVCVCVCVCIVCVCVCVFGCVVCDVCVCVCLVGYCV